MVVLFYSVNVFKTGHGDTVLADQDGAGRTGVVPFGVEVDAKAVCHHGVADTGQVVSFRKRLTNKHQFARMRQMFNFSLQKPHLFPRLQMLLDTVEAKIKIAVIASPRVGARLDHCLHNTCLHAA